MTLLRTQISMTSAARARIPEGQEYSDRLAWLLGDILNGAEEIGWNSTDQSDHMATVLLLDDPNDEIEAAEISANDSSPTFVVRLGQTSSNHMALYPGPGVGARVVATIPNPPTSSVGFGQMLDAVIRWLQNLPDSQPTSAQIELHRSVENLVATVAELSQDRGRLQTLLERSETERIRLEAEVERLSDLLKAKVMEGNAILRGEPVSRVETRSWAHGIRTHVFAGIVGNRADDAFLEVIQVAQSKAPELLDLARALVEVLRWSS